MRNKILFGDCRDTLTQFDEKARMCVTSPPYYGLRDYGGEDNQLGQEQTPEEFIDELVKVFRGVRDVLTDDGTCWVNIGDSYKEKDLIGVPWMFAFAMKADGWHLRQDIIWHKPNPMPESVRDRCTKSHEYIFLFSKNKRYYYNNEAIKEPAKDWGTRDRTNGKYHNEGTGLSPHSGLTKSYLMKNKRSVWSVTNKPYRGSHFAVYPPDLIEPCIKAGSEKGDLVLDPFMGSGTTAMVARSLGRDYIGCELHEEYGDLINKRIEEYNGIFQ